MATIQARSYRAGLAHHRHRFAAGAVLPVVRALQDQEAPKGGSEGLMDIFFSFTLMILLAAEAIQMAVACTRSLG